MQKPPYERKSIRVTGYDYGSVGWYFITICTYHRECIFGDIRNGEMIHSHIGKIVAAEWQHTTKIRSYVVLDEFVVMPNHLHGIVGITKDIDAVKNDAGSVGIGSCQYLHPPSSPFDKPIHTFGTQSHNLFSIIRGFKSATTKQVNMLLKNTEGGSIWQSRFHDHIIRNEEDMNRIREYIRYNPLKWQEDLESPVVCSKSSEKHHKQSLKKHYSSLFSKTSQ